MEDDSARHAPALSCPLLSWLTFDRDVLQQDLSRVLQKPRFLNVAVSFAQHMEIKSNVLPGPFAKGFSSTRFFPCGRPRSEPPEETIFFFVRTSVAILLFFEEGLKSLPLFVLPLAPMGFRRKLVSPP